MISQRAFAPLAGKRKTSHNTNCHMHHHHELWHINNRLTTPKQNEKETQLEHLDQTKQTHDIETQELVLELLQAAVVPHLVVIT